MKRCLAVLILLSLPAIHATDKVAEIVSTVVKNAAGSVPAKERLKTFGSVAFAVGGAVYLLASHYENKKFDQMKDLYSSDMLLDNSTKRAQDAGKLEGAFNIWRSIRYVSTASLITGSFLLGMSVEDQFNLV